MNIKSTASNLPSCHFSSGFNYKVDCPSTLEKQEKNCTDLKKIIWWNHDSFYYVEECKVHTNNMLFNVNLPF